MQNKRGISAVVVVKNEEGRIQRCLESIKWVNEIIIVDNGSTDSTLEICSKFTDKIFFHDSPFTGIKVNYGIEKASFEWILNIDADEVVSNDLKDEICSLVRIDKGIYNAYSLPFRFLFMGRWLRHGGWYPSYTKRFYKNGKARYTVAGHHIQVKIDGKVGCLNNPILHDGTADIDTFLTKMNTYTTNSSRVNFNKKKIAWFNILLRPLLIFIKRYFLLRGFLDGFPGFAIATLSAIYIFVDNIKFKERGYIMSRQNKK